MAQSKVPADPNISPEMRRFLDERARETAKIRQELQAAIDALPDFATEAEAEAGTVDDKTMSPATTAAAIAALNPFASYMHVRDEKSAGTAGGSFNSGSWINRDLNTELTNTIAGASLVTNLMVLPAGTYHIRSSAPAFACNRHQTRLFDQTNTATILIGTSEWAELIGGVLIQTRSWIQGAFTLSGTASLRIDHQCSQTRSTEGLGFPADLGINEVYTDVHIYKVA